MNDNYFKVVSGGAEAFFFFKNAETQSVQKALQKAMNQVQIFKIHYRKVSVVVWKRAKSVPSDILAVGETNKLQSSYEFN